ncbi:hypothetical protein GC207_06080 [bacterium]|nr:hypothetical protein [bacterium]
MRSESFSVSTAAIVRPWLRFVIALIALAQIDCPSLFAGDTNSPIVIHLENQWEKPAKLQAPMQHVTILTVADRAGAEQIQEWVAPLKKEFAANIDFFAVADLRAVPRPLRGFVRRRFAKAYDYPIGLDWSGSVANQLTIKEDVANLFVLDQQGRVQATMHGSATAPSIETLKTEIAKLIGKPVAKIDAHTQADRETSQ